MDGVLLKKQGLRWLSRNRIFRTLLQFVLIEGESIECMATLGVLAAIVQKVTGMDMMDYLRHDRMLETTE